jgi:CO/xanthine dehydrogenase Mo-binding subunit
MTGLIPEKEFSRKTLLKGGGALVVGFSLAGSLLTGKAQADVSPSPAHTGNVPGPPPMNQVDTWIAVNADNSVTVYGEKLELGQGTTTGLRQIAAEELGIGVDQIVWVRADTNVTPNQGGTVGSSGIRSGGPQIRAAAAYAAQALLGLASAQLGVPAASLTVANGVVSGGGRTVSYAQLIGDKLFNVTMPATTLQQGVAPAKPASAYTLVTTRVPRIDIPEKVIGTWTYMQNVRVPGMLHGRVVRPRGQGPYGQGAPIVSVDANSIASIPNVQIVQQGDFLGVVAPKEFDAIQAAAQLKVQWKDDPILPGSGNLFGTMLTQPTVDTLGVNSGNVGAGFAQAAKTVTATYAVDYQMHGSIGPTCAVAVVGPSSALVMCSAQDIYEIRPLIAQVLGFSEPQVRVQFYDSSGCFGHNCQYDSAEAAAIMAQKVGKPVRVQFMRWDEHGWDQYGPAALLPLRGAVDASGNIVGYDYISYEPPNVDLETSAELIGIPLDNVGNSRADANNSAGMYNITNRRVTGKSLPVLSGYLKTAPLRAPGAPQATFASEQMIDELAHASGMDPVAFRLQNLTDQRWITVIQTAAQAAGWQPRAAASQLSSSRVATGRGIGIGTAGGGTRAAVIAEVTVDKHSGKLTVNQIYTAQDAGLTINPGLVENQMMGAAVQGTSRATVEQVNFTKSRVTSLDWTTYPILRFKESPKVTTVVVQRTDQPATGSGEPPTVGAPAAIANAFFDATGVRIRQMPMTPGRVRATLKAAGVT